MKNINCRGLSAGSLYKLLFVGLLAPLFIFSLSCGVASYFGYATVTLNNNYVYGVKGLLVGVVLGLVLPVFMSALLWCLMAFGTWLWTRVRLINLTFKE